MSAESKADFVMREPQCTGRHTLRSGMTGRQGITAVEYKPGGQWCGGRASGCKQVDSTWQCNQCIRWSGAGWLLNVGHKEGHAEEHIALSACCSNPTAFQPTLSSGVSPSCLVGCHFWPSMARSPSGAALLWMCCGCVWGEGRGQQAKP